MKLLPKCRNCGTEFEQDEVLDMDFDDNGIDLFCVGSCPNCGKTYQWYRTAAIHSWAIDHLREKLK